MTYDFNHLPTKLLTPPVPPPYREGRDTWKRNWSLYFIYRHWTGSDWGMFGALSDWLAKTTRQKRLSRQRIQAIVRATHWSLRDYTDEQLGIDDSECQVIQPDVENKKAAAKVR